MIKNLQTILDEVKPRSPAMFVLWLTRKIEAVSKNPQLMPYLAETELGTLRITPSSLTINNIKILI
jgi:hypothetical protein